MYATVALLSPPYASLSYSLPPEFPVDFWRPGLRVAAPLGRGTLRAAVLLETSAQVDLPPGVACKSLFWPLEAAPLLPTDLLALAQDLARRQGLAPGHILGHVLPAGLRKTDVRLHCLQEGRAAVWSLARLRAADQAARTALAAALLSGAARLLPPGTDAASTELCLLRADPPWPVRPAAARQIAVLEYLQPTGPCAVGRCFGIWAGRPLRPCAPCCPPGMWP
jgi:primosomal protein N' (replication factor Y)